MKRTKCLPKLVLPIWRESAKGFSAARGDVLDTILRNGHTSEVLNRRMGVGITYLNDLIDGEELTRWEAYFVDCAIRPEEPPPIWHSYSPDDPGAKLPSG